METKHCKKTSFANEAAAIFYIDKLKRTSIRERVPIRAYLCCQCNSWHLTSKPNFESVKYEMEIIKLKNIIENNTNQINNLKRKIENISKNVSVSFHIS